MTREAIVEWPRERTIAVSLVDENLLCFREFHDHFARLMFFFDRLNDVFNILRSQFREKIDNEEKEESVKLFSISMIF